MLTSTEGAQAHFVFESLAYLVAARIFWRSAGAGFPSSQADRYVLLGSACLGALTGSKFLHVCEHLSFLTAQNQFALWLGGKSVLGGFLGGSIATEVAKRAIGWQSPTGDAWVPAIAAGLIIGRIGCQLSGTWDQTYGIPTDLPWGWNYGDGAARHPTALYEMILVALCLAATRSMGLSSKKGARFALFMLLYAMVRFGLEFLKPPFGAYGPDALSVDLFGGLTAIQWAALLGVTWYGALLQRRLKYSAEEQ